MTADWHETAFETRAIHVGQEPDPTTGAITTPIYQTSTFVQKGVGEHGAYEYGRTHNPTRTALQEVVASLEGAAWGLAYASGLAGTQNISYLLAPGDHIVLSDDAYGGTHRFVAKVISRYGIDYSVVDMSDLDADPRRHPAADPAHLGGVAHQPLSQDRRYPRRGRAHPRPPGHPGRRQHLCLALPAEPAEFWAPIWCSTPAPSTSAATPTSSAAWSSATTRTSTRRSSSIRTRAAPCRDRSTAGSCCAASRRCRCAWSGTAATPLPLPSSCTSTLA